MHTLLPRRSGPRPGPPGCLTLSVARSWRFHYRRHRRQWVLHRNEMRVNHLLFRTIRRYITVEWVQSLLRYLRTIPHFRRAQYVHVALNPHELFRMIDEHTYVVHFH